MKHVSGVGIGSDRPGSASAALGISGILRNRRMAFVSRGSSATLSFRYASRNTGAVSCFEPAAAAAAHPQSVKEIAGGMCRGYLAIGV